MISLLILLLINYTPQITSGSKEVPSIYINNQWTILAPSAQVPSYPSPVSTNYKLPTTEIFITINNFIDSERCSRSLYNLLQKAKYPNRLKFGLIQEVNTEESPIIDNCMKMYCEVMKQKYPCEHSSQMKSMIYSKRLSRGSAHAHASFDLLYENEDYCLQTDSHVDVIQDWDVELMEMWGQINNEYAILSTALPSIDILGKKINNRWEIPHLCHYSWDDNALPSTTVPAVAINLDEPLLASAWSDSFSFSKCHALKKTPNDPNIIRLDSSVTDVVKYARLWTRGYDVYSPHRSVIAHDMKPGSMEWKDFGMSQLMKTRELISSIQRIKTLFGIPGGKDSVEDILAIGKYGLGSKRSLAQLSQFIGIDFKHGQIVDDRFKINPSPLSTLLSLMNEFRCRRLEWVPFTPDADPQCDENDIWGYAPESQTAKLPLLPSDASSSALQEMPIEKSKTLTSLPWPFNFMDRIVELAVKELSVDSSRDEALQMLKIILLIIPMGAGLLALAIWAIISAGDDMRPPRKDSFLFSEGNDIKNI